MKDYKMKIRVAKSGNVYVRSLEPGYFHWPTILGYLKKLDGFTTINGSLQDGRGIMAGWLLVGAV